MPQNQLHHGTSSASSQFKSCIEWASLHSIWDAHLPVCLQAQQTPSTSGEAPHLSWASPLLQGVESNRLTWGKETFLCSAHTLPAMLVLAWPSLQSLAAWNEEKDRFYSSDVQYEIDSFHVHDASLEPSNPSLVFHSPILVLESKG